ncbi:MAG TPA: DUF302 domain-containing protein [Planktothrix sp.]|jgi:uncharacterized protein (DUF302 family)
MEIQYTVTHQIFKSKLKYEDVIQRFESLTGSVEGGAWQKIVASVKAGDEAGFTKAVKACEGTHPFMRFMTIDHSHWLQLMNINGRCRLYILGNPLIAQTMIRYDAGVGLNVPVRVLIQESDTGEVLFRYDQPSSLMSVLDNKDVSKAAAYLDQELQALAKDATQSV